MSHISINLCFAINPPKRIANKALQTIHIIKTVCCLMHVVSKVIFKAELLQAFLLPTNGAVQKIVLCQISQRSARC